MQYLKYKNRPNLVLFVRLLPPVGGKHNNTQHYNSKINDSQAKK